MERFGIYMARYLVCYVKKKEHTYEALGTGLLGSIVSIRTLPVSILHNSIHMQDDAKCYIRRQHVTGRPRLTR